MAAIPTAVVNVSVKFPRNLEKGLEILTGIASLAEALEVPLENVEISTELYGGTRTIHASFRGPVVT